MTSTGAPPSSSRASTGVLSSTLAEPSGPRELLRQGVDQRAHAAAQGEEDRRARIGGVSPTVAAQPEQQRARSFGHPRDLRRDRGRAQAIGAAGVDATDERVDEPFEHLAPEPPRDERAERVDRVGFHGSTRQHGLDRGPRQPTDAQQPRPRDRQHRARHAESEPCRQPAQRPARPTRTRPRSQATRGQRRDRAAGTARCLPARGPGTRRPLRRSRGQRTGTCGSCLRADRLPRAR